MSDAGPGSTEHSGHWKHIVLENAQDTQLTYTLTAPEEPGTYNFSGEYMFGGTESTSVISGQDTISVASSSSMNTVWVLFIVVLMSVVVATIFLKKIRG